MKSPPVWISRRLMPLAAALAATGCARLFVAPPPKYLFRLTPKSTYPANLPHVGAQLLIDLPIAPAALDRRRIALSKSPISLDYFSDAEWTDQVTALVQSALVTSFEISGTITAIDRESLGLRADFILSSTIRHFEAVYDAGRGPPSAWVAIDARLVAMPQRQIIARALFEKRMPAAADALPEVIAAFDDALGAVMKEIVAWTVTNPALSNPRRRVL
jgi:cholesterol transport system auxiliary component